MKNMDTDPLPVRKKFVQMELDMTLAMFRAGVPFMAGTDTAAGVHVFPGFSLHEELALFVASGTYADAGAADGDAQSGQVHGPRRGYGHGREGQARRSRAARRQSARGHRQHAQDPRRRARGALLRSCGARSRCCTGWRRLRRPSPCRRPSKAARSERGRAAPAAAAALRRLRDGWRSVWRDPRRPDAKPVTVADLLAGSPPRTGARRIPTTPCTSSCRADAS